MRLTRLQTLTALALSLAVHLAGAAIFVSPEEEMQIAGGAATSQLLIGTAFDDALMAGDPDNSVKPVEASTEILKATPPSETEAVEPIEPETVVPVTETASVVAPFEQLPPTMPDDIAATDNQTSALAAPPSEPALSPVIEALEPASLIESTPAASQELAALSSTSEITPVEQSEPVIAVPENVPVPLPRPAPPRADTATSKPPAKAMQKAAQAKPRTVKAIAEREIKRAPTKASAGGDGGKQRSTASKAASGNSAAKQNTAAGNAAVSNYPGKIASKLRRSLRYPREAKRQGIRGDVVVSFVVAMNGGVSGVRISRSSGSQILDGAAADAVRRAAPFPPIPAGAGRSNWSFSVPLGFTR